MSDERKPGTTIVSVARVISAAFVAMLLAGPPHAGWLGLGTGAISSVPIGLLVAAVRSFFAGILAGRRLAIHAGVLASVWAMQDKVVYLIRDLLAGDLEFWLVLTIMTTFWLVLMGALGALSGRIGGLVATHVRTDTLGMHSRLWVVVGVFATLTFIYSYAFGIGSAKRLLRDEIKKSAVDGHGPQVTAYVSGVFPAVHVWPYKEGVAWSEVFFTDPSGRLLVGKHCLPAD